MPTPPPSDPADSHLSRETALQPAPPPRRKLSRRASVIGTALALLVAAGLAWLAWDLTRPEQMASVQRGPAGGPGAGAGAGARGGGPAGGRGATTVGFAVAEAADIPVNLDALGTVTPLATVRVRPQVNGVMQQVLFKEGQAVRKGQLLATIDPRPFELALQQAVGTRMKDEAQLAAAKVTLTRYETLLQQDSIARQDVDTQRATVRQLEATIVSDKANEGTARLNVAYTRITAPIEGRVGLRNVDVGNQVSTSDTAGIAVITQLTPIEVQFAIPQDNAAWLQHNGGAFMEVKAYDRTRTTLLDTGAFASLDNQIDTTTGTVKAKARFNNARLQLFPSQFVNVQLQVRTIQNAVVVPVAAVRPSGTGEFVFVLLQDHTVKQRPVVRGQALGDRVQVVSGLQIGERVITEGADRLRDGSRVVLPGESPSGGAGDGTGRRRRDAASAAAGGASAAKPPATDPFGGASAAQAPQGVPATMGAAPDGAAAGPGAPAGGANRSQGLTPEQRAARAAEFQKLSPEEREARRRQRQQQGGGTQAQ
jgi:multidrug efflux system membrane fusion protein